MELVGNAQLLKTCGETYFGKDASLEIKFLGKLQFGEWYLEEATDKCGSHVESVELILPRNVKSS